MKTVVKGIIAAVVVVIMLGAGLLWYVQPEKELDLAFTELRLEDQAAEMLRTRKLELVLSEAEINDLLKRQLAKQALSSAGPQPQGRVTGAQFTLKGNELTADVNLLIRDQWKAAARLQFRLEWQEPQLVATHTKTELKGLSLPLSWYQAKPMSISLDEKLPKLLAVRNVEFREQQVHISFRLR